MKMGDLDLSLDDFIKQKLKKPGQFRGKNSPGNMKKPIRRISDPKSRVAKPQNLGVTPNKNLRTGGINSMRGKGSQTGVVGDARLKIIQKQRQKMTDAREKLGQIAKQTDARLRLMKLRERQRGSPAAGRLAVPFRAEHQILQRTVQSRMNSSYYDEELMDYSEEVSYPTRNFDASDDLYGFPYRNRQSPAVLYRTVENDMPPTRLYEQEKSIYTWTKPLHISDDIVDIPVTRTNSRMQLGIRKSDTSWDLDDTPIVITKKVKPQETVGILKRSSMFDGQAVKVIKESPPPGKSKPPARTLSERFCQEGSLSAQKISLLKAKLEANQKANKNNSTETQAPLGHRIVVSNLVPSVTHEDVKELFEDIGELISSKVVRPGTAEVVYKLHKDAVKAVDVYHNRQLDGQPMKCLLVNNRLGLPVTSKSVKGVGGKIGKGVVELDMTAFRKALHKKSTS